MIQRGSVAPSLFLKTEKEHRLATLNCACALRYSPRRASGSTAILRCRYCHYAAFDSVLTLLSATLQTQAPPRRWLLCYSMAEFGAELLRRQLIELSRNPPEGISVGLGEDENIYNWEIMIIGPPDTL